MNNTVNVAQTH